MANGTDSSGKPKADGELPSHPSSTQTFDFVHDENGDTIPPFGALYISTGGSSGLSDLTYNPAPAVYVKW